MSMTMGMKRSPPAPKKNASHLATEPWGICQRHRFLHPRSFFCVVNSYELPSSVGRPFRRKTQACQLVLHLLVRFGMASAREEDD